MYQINDLERLTGVKAHTIRIWEKRYSIIHPNRTETNRRYYDDTQMRKLLNVTTLLSQGHKISKIAAFSDDEIFKHIEKDAELHGSAHINTTYINDLVVTMLAFDEAGFEKVFSAAVLRMGMYETMLHVVYPFLNKTGVLWTINKTVPVQEHFASCIIRRKLMSATDGLLPPHKKNNRFLLFLPPGEWHEIVLLFSNYIIRSHGYDTIYLGQNVPVENIRKMLESVSVQHILTFFITTRPADELKDLVANYAGMDKKVKMLIAGNRDILNDPKMLPKNVSFMDGVGSLIELLK